MLLVLDGLSPARASTAAAGAGGRRRGSESEERDDKGAREVGRGRPVCLPNMGSGVEAKQLEGGQPGSLLLLSVWAPLCMVASRRAAENEQGQKERREQMSHDCQLFRLSAAFSGACARLHKDQRPHADGFTEARGAKGFCHGSCACGASRPASQSPATSRRARAKAELALGSGDARKEQRAVAAVGTRERVFSC
jgi:hypothetical protein